MEIPEEFRCCVCLSVAHNAVHIGCPHPLCRGCAEAGSLTKCPVCPAPVPPDRHVDAAFARKVLAARITCPCGAEVALLEAEEHKCAHTAARANPPSSPTLGRSPPPPAPNRSTFACPLCPARNLTSQGLIEHCDQTHSNLRGRIAAVCPICAAMPWGDPAYVSRDFLGHLRLRHHFEYEMYADFGEDDEEAVLQRVLAESAREAGVIPETRGARRWRDRDRGRESSPSRSQSHRPQRRRRGVASPRSPRSPASRDSRRSRSPRSPSPASAASSSPPSPTTGAVTGF